MKILGIDPGAHTGLCVLENGCIQLLKTVEPIVLLDEISSVKPGLIVMEDSNLSSFVWNKKGSHAQSLKVARDIGNVDMLCKMVLHFCAKESIPLVQRSPKQKGAKLDAKMFCLLTKWDKRSNQHERDACMVAWPHRFSNLKGLFHGENKRFFV